MEGLGRFGVLQDDRSHVGYQPMTADTFHLSGLKFFHT